MTATSKERTLRIETKRILARAGVSARALDSRARVEKVYEVYVLGCLLLALENLGARFAVHDRDDKPTSDYVLRLGPGLLSASASAPGFIRVIYKNTEYEVQNSLRVLGQSRVLHELDVCLLDRAEARRCRREGSDPLHTKIKFLAECKYYGSNLPLGLGREYLGLSNEFTLRVKSIVSNVGGDDVHTLITKHKGTENFDTSPWQPTSFNRFVRWLENELRQVLP